MTTAASHSGDGVSIAHGLVLTVLVVDDEIDARGIVKRLLEMNGATVSMAGSASEAMERILAGRPDVLVCDVYLSILAVSLIAGIIRYRLITFDFTQSVPGAAGSSFGDSLNLILLLWVLFARFFWFRDHFTPLLRHVRAEDPRGLVSGNPR
jgi:hypothetical protein